MPCSERALNAPSEARVPQLWHLEELTARCLAPYLMHASHLLSLHRMERLRPSAIAFAERTARERTAPSRNRSQTWYEAITRPLLHSSTALPRLPARWPFLSILRACLG